MTELVEAKQVGISDGDARIVLPGTWVRVPLDSEEVATAFAKRLVKRQAGKADRIARARREAVLELVNSAREAVNIGVHTYLMSLEILPGVPFPAALLFRDEEWPEASRPALAKGDVAAALTTATPEIEVAEGHYGPVGRRWEMVRHAVGEDDEEFLTLRLEYFIPHPSGAGVLMARANMSNVPAGEPFATLFDEIIDSIRFPERDEAGQGDEVSSSAQEPQVTSA